MTDHARTRAVLRPVRLRHRCRSVPRVEAPARRGAAVLQREARLLRAEPVRRREELQHRLEHLHLGEGIGPRAHQERDGDPAGDHPVRGPSGARPAPQSPEPGVHAEADGRDRAAGAERSAPGLSTRWSTRAGSTSSTTWRPRCRCGSSACCWASPRRTRRRSATRSTGACGSTRERPRARHEGLGVLDGGRFARLHRLAGGPPVRRPHDRAAQRRVRGRDRNRPGALPGRDPQLHRPPRRRRQRDDDASHRLGRQGAGRAPRPARPSWRRTRGSCPAPSRNCCATSRPHRSRPVTSPGTWSTTGRRCRKAACCC